MPDRFAITAHACTNDCSPSGIYSSNSHRAFFAPALLRTWGGVHGEHVALLAFHFPPPPFST